MQESIHADPLSLHVSREQAVAAIEELIREGVAEPGEFNVQVGFDSAAVKEAKFTLE